MLIIYIITIIISTILVFFCDYKINENTLVSALIKAIIFILCSVGLAYLIRYIRGDIYSLPNNNNNSDKNGKSDKNDNKLDLKNAKKNLLNAIQTVTDKIPGEINKDLRKDDNFFSSFITN